MSWFEMSDGANCAIQDNREFVIEVLGGGSGDGAGPIRIRESFHASMLAVEYAAAARFRSELACFQQNKFKCLCDKLRCFPSLHIATTLL